MYIYIYIYIYISLYIYIYIYTRVYTYIYIYTYVCTYTNKVVSRACRWCHRPAGTSRAYKSYEITYFNEYE